MINLMVGNNWDQNLLVKLDNLNKKYKENKIQITEVYGSVIDNPIGTARPIFRLKDLPRADIHSFVTYAHSLGISVNYTLNTSCFGSLDDLLARQGMITEFLRFLESICIDRVTVSHPLLMEIISDNSSIPIEVSTIYHASSIKQLSLLIARNNIDKVCMDLMRNRDFKFLTKMQDFLGNKLGKIVELMVNEMCNFECPFRASCYNLHGHTIRNARELFNDYPMGRCTQLRNDTLVEWLKARFILPQWLDYYEKNTGINSFKVTGRTGTTEYIIWVVEQYMKRIYDGNLIALWFQLENIGKSKEKHIIARDKINAKEIRIDFLEFFKNIDCHLSCNVSCNHCDKYLKKILEANNGKV